MNKNSPVQLLALFRKTGFQRGSMFGIILLVALFAFEVFNYTTTDFSLTDLLGKDLTFAGLRWATILSIAFCGIDFAGIARLFTPETGTAEPAEVWYLFGAWILAAAMNASLTWWGVAVAINGHTALGSTIIERETLTKVVPVFVAVMVWIIRILIIGSFSMAGERLFSMASDRASRAPVSRLGEMGNRPVAPAAAPRPMLAASHSQHGNPGPSSRSNPSEPGRSIPPRPVRPEPSYHPIGMAAKPRDEDQAPWH